MLARLAPRAIFCLLGAALFSSSCKRSDTLTPLGPSSSQANFVVQSINLPNLVSVDWDLKFWFLDASPPAQYNEYAPPSSVQPGGRIDAVLPCLTNASGVGRNQVQATAQLWFAGQTTPVQGTGSALFNCVRDADAPVNIVISIVLPANAGFVDPTGTVTGVGCASKIDWKDDGWLAVCADSSCGDEQSVFIFANACQALDGSPATFWACGAGADWTISGVLASSYFAVPPGDGSWNFGITALPHAQLSPPDPTLTDASGNLLVYSNIPTPLATLVRSNGQNTSAINSTRVADFAADLVLAANSVGGPAPHQLLELHNGSSGVTASAWTQLGTCDPAVLGTQSWPGLFAIDVRLTTPASAMVVLAATPNGVATQSATCTAQWASNQVTPQVSCSGAGPLP